MTAQRAAPLRCRIGDIVYEGRAVTVGCAVDPRRLLEAIRTGEAAEGRVTVEAPTPQPVHEHVGYVHPEMGLRTRTALARAGRTLGMATPYDDRIEDARGRLDSLTVEEGALTSRRRAVADTADETAKLRERVAAVRGRRQVAREHGTNGEQAARELEAAVQELSERETERAAARQRLERARESARERRDRRERVLALEDELANLQRNARAHLREQCRDRYADAVAAVPGSEAASDPFATDPVTAALAIARLASLSAPLVLDCDRFDSAAAASRWLDAPVVRV